MISLTITVN